MASIPGDAAFKLYDTHGLPRDFIEDMVEDRKLRLDQEGFERAMEAQREKARAKSAFKSADAKDAAWTVRDDVRVELESAGDRAFRGYETTTLNTQVLALFNGDRQEVQSLAAGQDGFSRWQRPRSTSKRAGRSRTSARLPGLAVRPA